MSESEIDELKDNAKRAAKRHIAVWEESRRRGARLDRALALLREVEWVEGEWEFCPVCGENPKTERPFEGIGMGHAADCKLKALLEESDE